jgi:hypothetical protein
VCSATGLGGATLATGDVVTGATNLLAVSIQNGNVKVTYRENLAANAAGCHMYINGGHTADGHEDSWTRCFDAVEADWSYWAVAPTATADRIRVLEATDDAAEISIEWDAYDLTGYSLGAGFNSRDYARNLIYPASSSTPRQIASVHLRKTVRIQRGVQGYYVAWHATPVVVPMITAIGQAANNELDLGEREFGTGGGSRVIWTRDGKTCYAPAWRTQRDWSAFAAAFPSADNYACWLGSDDPTASPWNHATAIAMQFSGYPAETASGGFYVGDLYPTANIVRCIVQKNPNPIGVWHYDGQNGILVNHLTNPWTENDGRLTRYPLFIGADHYVADSTAVAKAGYTGSVSYGNEPSATAQTLVSDLAAAALEDWPT